ncbi:MAG TPA: tetratricopeptide repeat protein [Candidatus Acidoferrum sp.]|nr:tetratricopeptide repeat protein [Candidatus Acidoferrum sp.]
MPRIAAITVTLLLVASLGCKAQDTTPKPLTAAGVLALVAGGALAETTAHAIEVDGISFRPDDFYRGLLTTAGADPKVFAALSSAKIAADIAPENQPGKGFLQHFANAGAFTHNQDYEHAGNEMAAAATAQDPCPECAFVQGYVLQRHLDWQRAQSAFEQVLDSLPAFPGVHARLALVYLNEDDAYAERALAEARTALLQYSDDPEGHKNEAMALAVLRQSQSAIGEYQVAVRLKPDYEAAHYDLAALYGTLQQYDNAIAEYRIAQRLDPKDADAFYNMGNALNVKGDLPAAIRAYRDAKAIAPDRYDIRQNLGAALIGHNENAEAVLEFRELVKMYPDAQMAVNSLGLALVRAWKFDEAIPVLRKAADLDPSDAHPHYNLGAIFEEQQHDDDALKEYSTAVELDETNGDARRGLGRILVRKKDYSRAAEEMKQASLLMMGDPDIHKLYGEALKGLGKLDAAIGEFRQAASLDPSKLQTVIELAAALEQKGDWVDALEQYHRAAAADASIDLRGKMMRVEDRDPQREYTEAKKRFDAHLAALRSSGKSSDAAALEGQVAALDSKQGVSAQIDSAMQSGVSSTRQRNFSEARQYFQKAIDLEDQLKPHDTRLVTALDSLGMTYVGEDPNAARATFERELKVATEIYGPQSASLTGPLESLGNNALMQKDYASASTFFFRAVDLNEKFFGEGSNRVADSLVQASAVYFVQKDYAKAEPYLLRAVHIDESLYGKDNIDLLVPLATLCQLYDRWDKPDHAAACDQQLITILEKQYGPTSTVLVTTLAGESGALRKLGRADEANKLDQRVSQIRSATMTSP